MPADASADAPPFERLRTDHDGARRLALVVATGMVALLVIGLAWTFTPAGAPASSTGVLVTGALGVTALTVVALAAELRDAQARLDAHAEALDLLDEVRKETWAGSETTPGAVSDRVSKLEDRLDTVEERQTEQVVEWLQNTDPPGTGDTPQTTQG